MVIISTTFAYVVCLFHYSRTGVILCNTLDVWKYICNCLLIFQNGLSVMNFLGINNPLWYLSVLLVLYCIHYIEMYISKKYKVNINYLYLSTLIIYIVVSVLRIDIPILNLQLARGVIPFYIGCLLVTINDKLKNKRVDIYSFICLLIIGIIYIVDDSIIILDLQNYLRLIIYPLFILFCLNSWIVNKITDHKIIGELGKISFEVYIWHAPIFFVMMIINNYFNIFPLQERWFMLLTALIIVLWSALMYYFVEKPITNKLLDIYYAKYNNKQPV